MHPKAQRHQNLAKLLRPLSAFYLVRVVNSGSPGAFPQVIGQAAIIHPGVPMSQRPSALVKRMVMARGSQQAQHRITVTTGIQGGSRMSQVVI